MVRVICLCVCVFAGTALAQSRLVAAGSHSVMARGTAALGSATGTGDYTLYVATVGYSLLGYLDIQGEYKRISEDFQTGTVGVATRDGNFYGASIEYLVFKEAENIPVSLFLGTGFYFKSYSSAFYDARKSTVDGYEFPVRLGLSRGFPVGARWEAYPFLRYQLSFNWETDDNTATDKSETSSTKDSSLKLGVAGTWPLNAKNKLFLTPSASFMEETSEFGAELGYIVSF